MRVRRALRSSALVMAIAAVLSNGRALGVDLHAFWDQRCHECHGHAGKFAREVLSVTDGRLVGRHHTDSLRLFLSQHYMSEPLAGRVYDMLLAQASTEPIYQARCAGCHQTAADLVRNDIDVEGDLLVGKKGRRPLSQFLLRHGGGLIEGDLTTVLRSLERIRTETSMQPKPKLEFKQ